MAAIPVMSSATSDALLKLTYFAAHDMADLHRVIVDYASKVVGRHAIRFDHDKVFGRC